MCFIVDHDFTVMMPMVRARLRGVTFSYQIYSFQAAGEAGYVHPNCSKDDHRDELSLEGPVPKGSVASGSGTSSSSFAGNSLVLSSSSTREYWPGFSPICDAPKVAIAFVRFRS